MSTPSPELLHHVADSILESDAVSLLYTGIQLIEFYTFVSCLQPFASTSSPMPVFEQLLMTLLKLRQNFLMADLVQGFKTSEGQVSKTIGMWIDLMSEHISNILFQTSYYVFAS